MLAFAIFSLFQLLAPAEKCVVEVVMRPVQKTVCIIMKNKLSKRLQEVTDALPLREEIRVLEIGSGSGAASREIAMRISKGHVLGIDRSGKAIKQAI
jgi:methylase of polypeptide subunit release factors